MIFKCAIDSNPVASVSDYGHPDLIMNIILLGYRGSGKTTIGKLLAEQLWKDFVDVDQLVMRRMGNRSIKEIWATDGEPKFREVEVQVTIELCQRTELVIALGGGTVMQEHARHAIQHAPDCKRIYLYCETPELVKRLSADSATPDQRPSLTLAHSLHDEITSVLALRDPIYRSVADQVFDVTHLSPADAARYLIDRCLR